MSHCDLISILSNLFTMIMLNLYLPNSHTTLTTINYSYWLKSINDHTQTSILLKLKTFYSLHLVSNKTSPSTYFLPLQIPLLITEDTLILRFQDSWFLQITYILLCSLISTYLVSNLENVTLEAINFILYLELFLRIFLLINSELLILITLDIFLPWLWILFILYVLLWIS